MLPKFPFELEKHCVCCGNEIIDSVSCECDFCDRPVCYCCCGPIGDTPLIACHDCIEAMPDEYINADDYLGHIEERDCDGREERPS